MAAYPVGLAVRPVRRGACGALPCTLYRKGVKTLVLAGLARLQQHSSAVTFHPQADRGVVTRSSAAAPPPLTPKLTGGVCPPAAAAQQRRTSRP